MIKKYKFGVVLEKLNELYCLYKSKHFEILSNPELKHVPFLFNLRVRDMFSSEWTLI